MSKAPKKLTSANINCARVDPGKINNYPLPGNIIQDLQDAFAFYDKAGDGFISIAHFRNILHNFGFHSMQKKEIDEELKQADPDFLRRTAVEYPVVKYVIGRRWTSKAGNMEEATECFKLFDKRDRDVINAGDLKQVLSNYLEFPVTESDIKDFIAECGGGHDGTGNVTKKEFCKLYLS